MKKSFQIFLVLLFAASCSHTLKNSLRVPSGSSSSGALVEITEEEASSFPKLGDRVPIKFVVFKDAAGKWSEVTMIDPRKRSFHHEYLSELSQFKGYGFHKIEAVSFNKLNRQVLLGVMFPVMDMKEGQWDFYTAYSLNTEEVLDVKDIKIIENSLANWNKKHASEQSTLEFGPYRFQPLRNQEQDVQARLKEFETAGLQVQFEKQKSGVVVYNSGWGIGTVVVAKDSTEVESRLKAGEINLDTILIVGSDLRELPPVAGVISAVPLTEASHTVLLAQMYGIPLVHDKEALKYYAVQAGSIAFLQTLLGAENQFDFVPRLRKAEVDYLKQFRDRKKLSVLVDWSADQITPTVNLKPEQVASFGGKSTKTGLIRRTIPEFTKPQSVGIPISFYKKFLETSKTPSGVSLQEMLKKKLQGLSAKSSYFEVDERMKEIREAMKGATLDTKLIETIRQKLMAYFPGTAVRLKLRSSSNVEDGAEFNGAGLYESEGVCLSGCPKDDFAKGLVKVWSSLYTTRGYHARTQFQVPEELVGMGILVHTSYKNEKANGVVKFKKVANYEKQLVDTAEILGVSGEEQSVTNSTQGGQNEKVVVEAGTIREYRGLKNTLFGRKMMRDEHYFQLTRLMAQLYDNWPDQDKPEIEAEWKLIEENGVEKVNIKQVRSVPKSKQPKISGIKKYVLTNGAINFAGAWQFDSYQMIWRIDNFSMNIEPFTDLDFKAAKLKISNVQMKILGQVYPMKVHTQRVQNTEYGTILKFEISNPNLPKTKVSINMSNESPTTLMSLQSSAIYFNIEMLGLKGELMQHSIRDVSAAAEKVFEDSPAVFDFLGGNCPVRIKATSAKRFLNTDNEFRSLDFVEVTGLLKRPIQIKSGYPSANYHYQQHEAFKDVWIDVMADTSLTASEKADLEKREIRYIQIKARSDSALLWNSTTSKSKPIPSCESEHSSEEEDGDDADAMPGEAVG